MKCSERLNKGAFMRAAHALTPTHPTRSRVERVVFFNAGISLFLLQSHRIFLRLSEISHYTPLHALISPPTRQSVLLMMKKGRILISGSPHRAKDCSVFGTLFAASHRNTWFFSRVKPMLCCTQRSERATERSLKDKRLLLFVKKEKKLGNCCMDFFHF